MGSILLGLTRQYFNAFRTVAAPLWAAIALLLIGGPWLGLSLMEMASRGEFDPESLPVHELRLVCHLLAALFFGFGCVVGLCTTPTYIFRLPISSRLIASWHFVASAVTVAVCNALMTTSYRLLFDATLSYAVTVPMIVSVHLLLWLVWMFVPMVSAQSQQHSRPVGEPLRRQLVFAVRRLAKWCPVFLVLAVYFVWRVNNFEFVPDWLDQNEPGWRSVTVIDLLVLVPVSGLAWLQVAGEIERQRHGDINVRLLMEHEADSLLTRLAHQQVPAPGQWSRVEAHRWFHWESGRTLLLFGTLFVVPLMAVIYLAMFAERAHNKFEGVMSILIMMPVLGAMLVGATLGLNTVNPAGRREMKKHLAVLPVSDRDMSRTMLGTFAKTVGGVWCVVFGVSLLALGVFCAQAGPEKAFAELKRIKEFQNLDFWLIPLYLLLAIQAVWTVGGLTVSLAWTGREQLFTKVYLALVVLAMPTFITAKLFVAPGYQIAVFAVILGILAIATVWLVAWSYRRARRRDLLEPTLAHGAFAVWVAEAVLCLTLIPEPLSIRLAMAGLIGLSVLPITAGPLAVAWNRHR
jgi:hypothetical protein